MNDAPDPDALRSRIESLSSAMTIHDLRALINDVFTLHFGTTSDTARMDDITGEFHEFTRALSRRDRLDEFGDLLSSLLAFSAEQDADPILAVRKTLLKIERRADLYAARGNKENVAIYGGSLDPVTNGHLAAIKAVLASSLGITQVWVMPANAAMGSKRLTDARHRSAMCRLLEEVDPRIKFFGYEIDKKLSSETRQTLLHLSREAFADRHRFHFVVSMDVANSIQGWADADELIRAAPFITLPRPGYAPDLRNPWFLKPPHRYLADAQGLIEVSSTEVKAAYRAGELTRAATLVPPKIHAYILEHGLYRDNEAA